MNIEDLWSDIDEMEEMGDVGEEVVGMRAIANAFENDDMKLCESLIMAFRIKYGVKINII